MNKNESDNFYMNYEGGQQLKFFSPTDVDGLSQMGG